MQIRAPLHRSPSSSQSVPSEALDHAWVLMPGRQASHGFFGFVAPSRYRMSPILQLVRDAEVRLATVATDDATPAHKKRKTETRTQGELHC